MASILIVDDDQNILMLLSEVLNRLNHQVTKASDGSEAIPLIQQQNFDLVISDLHMKKINGIEVLKAVKEKDKNLDVLILTGYATVQSAVKAMKFGAYDYLTKPLNIEELKVKVPLALEHQSLKLRMAEQERQLRAHQATIERDLKLAATIQQTLVPRPFENHQIRVDVYHLPIIGVGGDFADIYYAPNKFIYLNLIDVTGHGIASALIVNRISSDIRKWVHEELQPQEILFRLNNFIVESFYLTGMFLTGFSCYIDLIKYQLVYAGSAHPPALLWQQELQRTEKLESQNTILGFDKSSANMFSQTLVPIRPGDRLLMYTDGIIEAENNLGDQFGIEGLIAALETSQNDASNSTIQYLLEKMNRFREKPIRDDIYLVNAEIK
jgi:sigma-B regulation protein RsbU (phosphoserine phosphatase)